MSLSSLENEFAGERVFLIGNGPSLQETPLDDIADEYAFGVNKINYIYTETEWRPTFYVLHQEKLTRTRTEECVTENIESGRTCFINEVHRDVFGDHDNVYYFERRSFKSKSRNSENNVVDAPLDEIDQFTTPELREYWSDDISEHVYTYHTMYGVLQIATYLGFDEIYLLGCDLGFDYHAPHMIFDSGLDPYKYSPGLPTYGYRALRERTPFRSLVNWLMLALYTSGAARAVHWLVKRIASVGNENHFDSDYRIKPMDNRRVNDEITRSHMVAKRIADESGVDIYNATLGGELEVYPRVEFSQVAG